MKYQVRDRLIDSEGDIFKVTAVDYIAKKYYIDYSYGTTPEMPFSISQECVEQEFTKIKGEHMNSTPKVTHPTMIKPKTTIDDLILQDEAIKSMMKPNKEADPSGLDQHKPGAKLDAGKLRPDLVLGDFSLALKAIAEVGTFGANKYSDSGWLTVPNGRARYKEAAYRHYLDEKIGGEVDLQSGLLHEAHRAWNVLAALELKLRGTEDE